MVAVITLTWTFSGTHLSSGLFRRLQCLAKAGWRTGICTWEMNAPSDTYASFMQDQRSSWTAQHELPHVAVPYTYNAAPPRALQLQLAFRFSSLLLSFVSCHFPTRLLMRSFAHEPTAHHFSAPKHQSLQSSTKGGHQVNRGIRGSVRHSMICDKVKDGN